MNFWVGVIVGAGTATILFVAMMFSVIQQNEVLSRQISELSAEVSEHEKIMRLYEFYNWNYSLKMETEDLK